MRYIVVRLPVRPSVNNYCYRISSEAIWLCNKNKHSFFQIFGLVAFIEQKENNNNDNLFKIHGGLYIASALMKTTNNQKFAKRVFVFIALPLPYGGLQ